MMNEFSQIKHLIRQIISESKNDYFKKVGKVISYFDRPFRVRDIFTRPSPTVPGTEEVFFVGTFDDEENSQIYYAPVEKTGKKIATRAKNPEGFDKRNFLEKDIESFLIAANDEDGRANIHHVRDRWEEISKELSWMEKYIFDNKWLNTPMAKTNEEISEELATKQAIIKSAETRAFHKIERIIMRDDSINHDLNVIKQARMMYKNEQPIQKIIIFLKSELKNPDWMKEIDFLKGHNF